MRIQQSKRFHVDRVADRRRHHRHHRGDRGARSAPRPHVGQRSVGHRLDARHQHLTAELLAAVQRLRAAAAPSCRLAGNFLSPDLTTVAALVQERLHGDDGGSAAGDVRFRLLPAGCIATTTNYYATAVPLSFGSTGTRVVRDHRAGHDLLRQRGRGACRPDSGRRDTDSVTRHRVSSSPAWPRKGPCRFVFGQPL